MPLIAHPVILPDQDTHTLLTAWVTTCTQNLSRLLSEEGFKRAHFFFSTVLPLRPGVVNVQSLTNTQIITRLSKNPFTITSGLRPSCHPSQLQLWLGVKWEPQSDPQELWILTLNPELLTQPWTLLSQSEVSKQQKQPEQAPTPKPKPKRKRNTPKTPDATVN